MNRTLWHCSKFASPFWHIQAIFWQLPAKKVHRQCRRSCSGRGWRRQKQMRRSKRSRAKTRPWRRPPQALLRRRTPLVCASQLSFWSRQNREGQFKICLLFLRKKLGLGFFLKDIPKLDWFGCASRYVILWTKSVLAYFLAVAKPSVPRTVKVFGVVVGRAVCKGIT